MKLAVYPYNNDFTPVIRYRELLKENVEIIPISPIGFSLHNKDAGLSDNGCQCNITVVSDFDKIIKYVDKLFICESHYSIDYQKSIKPKIIQAINNKKEIILTIDISQEETESLGRLAKENNVKIEFFNRLINNYSHFFNPKKKNKFLQDISVPVVFVLGLSENAKKFETQLSLYWEITKMGYKIALIGSRHYCERFNFFSFPNFMFTKDFTETEKILMFNQYVKNIELTKNPDLIIIGIPGGIMPLSKRFSTKFGITAFLVSNALSADIALLNIYFENYETTNIFEQYSLSVQYKLNTMLDYFVISNVKNDFTESSFSFQPNFLFVGNDAVETVKNRVNIMSTPVYSLQNELDRANMAKNLIEKLQS